MDCRDKLESYFREQGVAFEVKEHPTAYTAQRIAATEHVPGRAFAKVVIARSDGTSSCWCSQLRRWWTWPR